MKRSLLFLLTIGTVATLTITSSRHSAAEDEPVRFICASGFDKQTNQYLPTTYAWTPKGKQAMVRWKYQWFKSKSWTPLSRCQEVAPRLQEAYNNGSLKYLTPSERNGQPVICTARQEGDKCTTLILTLRPEDDAIVMIARLAKLLRGGGGNPIQHSSSQSQVYYPIDFDKFLQTAPVEDETSHPY
jgi:hypothetical protein